MTDLTSEQTRYEKEAAEITNAVHDFAKQQIDGKTRDSAAALARIAKCLQRIFEFAQLTSEVRRRRRCRVSSDGGDNEDNDDDDEEDNDDAGVDTSWQFITEAVADVERAVSDGRDNCMKLALRISDVYTSRVLPLERRIAEAQRKTQREIVSVTQRLEQNQVNVARLRGEAVMAIQALESVPLEADMVQEKLAFLKGSSAFFGASSVAFATAIVFPPMFAVAAATSVVGIIFGSEGHKAAKQAKRLMAKVQSLKEQIEQNVNSVVRLGKEKEQLENRAKLLPQLVNTLHAMAGHVVVTRADSQKLEACAAQEQSLSNQLMLSASKLKHATLDESTSSANLIAEGDDEDGDSNSMVAIAEPLEEALCDACRLAAGLFALAETLLDDCCADAGVSREFDACWMALRELRNCVRPLSKPAWNILPCNPGYVSIKQLYRASWRLVCAPFQYLGLAFLKPQPTPVGCVLS